ncbi:5'-3' exoribonuclease 1-like, partial [Hyalella azteca]|uniref:5'-3' exoribonuclease 1-like n=1 Tax=Hyalella azteca TaxID=294128 RepID=A0A8B7PSM3_HYAAZ
MGVPKFYRWISKRYPTIVENVRPDQVPDFDNLYLDMNGIIHSCSHPDEADPCFRITEEQIFEDIFHYIESLFCMIRPKKVFFLAIDGVAPRAKMGQMRSGRYANPEHWVIWFSRCQGDEKSKTAATEKGKILPPGEPFDPNCITPGT